jgi:hypothetical protein
VEATLLTPEQIILYYAGKHAYQSQFQAEIGRIYLLRIIVRDDISSPRVMTIYKTSKVRKYGREEK